VFVDCIGVGVIIATALWYAAAKLFLLTIIILIIIIIVIVIIIVIMASTVTVAKFHSSTELFSEESCSVIGLSVRKKMSFQLRSELPATDMWRAEVMWKCVPDDRSRNGETSLADAHVGPLNEQVAAASRTE